MRLTQSFDLAVASAALVLLAACADQSVLAPREAGRAAQTVVLDCTADTRAQSLACREGRPQTGGARPNLILGGQGAYLRMASSGVNYDGAAVFRANVTVQNLMGQPIGTNDGTTVASSGIQVFFASGPTVTGGTGAVTVANADGIATFLAPNQPFFRYVERLTTEQVSTAHEWRFSVPATVTQFAFTVYVSAPVAAPTALQKIDTDPRTLAVGGNHTCALTTTGLAYCWGADDHGQLGSPAADSVPVPVAGGLQWREITAGRNHTCGITTESAAYCWGDDQTGQLGDGGGGDSHVPVPVAGGFSWLHVDAGAGHTCGVTTGHLAYCWGDGSFGQLGAGDSTSSSVPVLVAGGHLWASVSAGADHSCGVTQGGALYCWGNSDVGQLANNWDTTAVRPALSAPRPSWISVSAGDKFACGVNVQDQAMCWGSDLMGQMGNSSDPASGSPQLVAGGMAWARIDAGRLTTCGITTGGAGYCWGYNPAGLGMGATIFTDAPLPLFGGHHWVSIGAGDYHMCGVDQNGVALCWGQGLQGQLGTGSTANSQDPAVVSGGHVWAQ